MEELLPKDNEIVPTPTDGPATTPARSFTAAEMVACENCLRANPPTRVACLYCGSSMPLTKATRMVQRPALRPLEKWELGYNNILLPSTANLEAQSLAEAANLLRLEADALEQILRCGQALPIARSSSREEAELIQLRLKATAIRCLVVADAEMGVEPPIKIRSLKFDGDQLEVSRSREEAPVRISCSDLQLLLSARLRRKRVELKEEKKRHENRVLEADQFFSDESVVEFFIRNQNTPYRILAGSFDFSFLGAQKRLLANQNIERLVDMIQECAPNMVVDDSYNELRKTLEFVWPSDQTNQSTGWQRGRPGKVSFGSVTETSNESQFSRYSRLRYFLLTHPESNDLDV